ncbi:MAG: Rieske 2Fe-2S domain-containing protein [Nitrosopumilaceae archaeon]
MINELSIVPGTRAMVWGDRLYKNDVRTPNCYRPATIVCRYGRISTFIEREYGREAAKYPDLVDVVFDYKPERVSKGGPLSQGVVHGKLVTCPLHAWNIHLDTGCAVAPDRGCIKRYDVKVENNKIFIQL